MTDMLGGSGSIMAMIASLKLNNRKRISYFVAQKNQKRVVVVYRKISKISPEERRKWILKYRLQKEERRIKDLAALDFSAMIVFLCLFFLWP